MLYSVEGDKKGALVETKSNQITQKRALEEARLQAEQCIHCADPMCVDACPHTVNLPDLLGVMNGGVSALSDVLRARGELINTLAHDLRTPLGVIIGYIGMMEEGFSGAVTPELEKSLRPIRKNAQELLAMLNEFLSFSRLESGKDILHAEEFPLRDLVSDLGEGIAPLAHAKGLEFQWDVSGDCRLRSDSHKIREIVYNLLTNAVKYTEKGSVTLWAGYDPVEDQIWFKVTDTGRGISESELGRIFEAFHQAGVPLAPGDSGVGLGLAIVKRLLDLLQGRIEVRSVLKEGSTFQVFLPRVLAPVEV